MRLGENRDSLGDRIAQRAEIEFNLLAVLGVAALPASGFAAAIAAELEHGKLVEANGNGVAGKEASFAQGGE